MEGDRINGIIFLLYKILGGNEKELIYRLPPGCGIIQKMTPTELLAELKE